MQDRKEFVKQIPKTPAAKSDLGHRPDGGQLRRTHAHFLSDRQLLQTHPAVLSPRYIDTEASKVIYMATILAIESAIAGGSLSLIRGDVELGNWIGRADVSRAEEILVNIDAMLTACGVSKHDLDLIAVSAGPGSFTGIRIGMRPRSVLR